MAEETLTAPAPTPETLRELEEVVRRGPAYSFSDAMLACEHLPALIASARRTQQAEADVERLSPLGKTSEYRRILDLTDERDAALKRATDAEKAIRQAIEDQTKHLGQVTACAVAGSILHRGESDCTEGVIKGLEFALEALQPGAAS